MMTKKALFFVTLIIFMSGLILQPTTNFVNASGPNTSGPNPTQFYLNARVNLSGAGYLSVGSGYYNEGTTLVVNAYTNTGFVFDGWYLDGVYQGKLSSYVLQMNKGYELIATFSKCPVSLSITINPLDGATTAPAPGISSYNYGDNVIVTEYPRAGYTFDGWYLDGSFLGSGSSVTVNMNRDHQLSAYFGGNPSATAAPTPSPTPTPTQTPTPIATPTPAPSLPSPAIAFSCKSSTDFSGFNVQVNGLLTFNGVGLSGAGVLLSYSITGGNSWIDLAYVTTNDDGSFSAAWMPSATGNYLINATWTGDTAYSRASSVVNFAVTPFVQGTSVFSVVSNSTLSSFSFDSTTKELSFSVSGTSGTLGYVGVSIPKSLMSDASELSVSLDGQPLSYYTESQPDSWVVSFSYHHSTHSVVMNLNPEVAHPTVTPSPTIVPTPTPTIEPSETSLPTTQPSQTASPTNEPSAQPAAGIFDNMMIYIVIVAVVVIIVLVVALVLVMKRSKNKT